MRQKATPRISVILATNRSSEFLAEALESVVQQSSPDWEMIVVDDGQFESATLARDVEAIIPGSTIVRGPALGSPGLARNAGIAAASGEFIAFLDDDDRWPSQWLAAHLAGHAAHPQCGATYAGFRNIDSRGVPFGQDPGKQVDAAALARREVTILTGTIVVRRRILDSMGGFAHYGRAEDLDLALRLARSRGLVHVPGVLMDYRTHSHNVTRNHRALVRSISAILQDHLATARLAGDRDLQRALREGLAGNARYAHWAAARAAREHLRANEYRAAVGELLWALRTAPSGLGSWAGRRIRRLAAGTGLDRLANSSRDVIVNERSWPRRHRRSRSSQTCRAK